MKETSTENTLIPSRSSILMEKASAVTEPNAMVLNFCVDNNVQDAEPPILVVSTLALVYPLPSKGLAALVFLFFLKPGMSAGLTTVM